MSALDKENVEAVLEKVRPFLQMDGGDVEFCGILENGIVKVRLLGSCSGCPLSMMTLRAGIERALMKEIPEVKRIEAVK
ncbi:MAG: Fe/S biogenesis protein NfuA [Ignavibacteria bacterium]|nr:Fe/S biogenesis protein NfuA [Ignavibacteria bacterium]